MPETVRLLYLGGREADAGRIETAFRRRGVHPTLRRVADHGALRSALAHDDWDVVLCDHDALGLPASVAVDQFMDCDPLVPLIVVSDPIEEGRIIALMRSGARDVVLRDGLADLPGLVERELVLSTRRRKLEMGRKSKLEATLNASESRYRLIVDNANDGICMFDRDVKITFANRKLGEMLGYAADDLIGTDLLRLLDNESQQMARQRFEYRRTGKQLAETFECSFTHSDGRKITAIVTSTPYSAGDGWGGCFLLIADVTEIRITEAALRQSQRMGALSVLAGGMAHDINNMLMPIIGLTEIALKEVPEGGRAEQCLEKVIDAAERVTETVRGLLAFSRAELGERKPRAFKGVVANAVALLRLALPSTIVIDADIDGVDGQVRTDPVEINQVLMSLATNAKTAMGEKGVLHISLRRVERPDGGGSIAGAPPQFLQLKVRDTGSGIAEDRIESIFDPFNTTAPVGNGTGLGLSVVHGIVTDHDGSIELQSRPGEGAEFTLYFPICADGEEMPAAEARRLKAAG